VHGSTGSGTAGAKPAPDKAGRAIPALAAAWVLSLGFDLFLHAGVFARLYVEPSGFLLAPEDAFRRIPLGYGAFLVLTLGLYWLIRQLGIRGAIAGFRFGVVTGAVVWGAFTVGLYSIATARLSLVAAWWIGQAIELGLAGAVLGTAAAGLPLKRIWAVVGVIVIACVIATVVLQTLGLAPPMKTVG
jgi:hypothetical protein